MFLNQICLQWSKYLGKTFLCKNIIMWRMLARVELSFDWKWQKLPPWAWQTCLRLLVKKQSDMQKNYYWLMTFASCSIYNFFMLQDPQNWTLLLSLSCVKKNYGNGIGTKYFEIPVGMRREISQSILHGKTTFRSAVAASSFHYFRKRNDDFQNCLCSPIKNDKVP
jgi:hypothetical protein